MFFKYSTLAKLCCFQIPCLMVPFPGQTPDWGVKSRVAAGELPVSNDMEKVCLSLSSLLF